MISARLALSLRSLRPILNPTNSYKKVLPFALRGNKIGRA